MRLKKQMNDYLRKFGNSTEFYAIGINRLRMGTDGEGVTTLVGGYGCPLKCKYCLNNNCHDGDYKIYTFDELYELIKTDSLYFEATGGGVTFGGGEPLLQAEFIAGFVDFVKNNGHNWRFTIETSLAVEWTKFVPLIGRIDSWIIDLKDSNEEIYRAYTGASGETARQNLKRLAREYADECTPKIRVKLPLIPNFNSKDDLEKSLEFVKSMGINNIDKLNYVIK